MNVTRLRELNLDRLFFFFYFKFPDHSICYNHKVLAACELNKDDTKGNAKVDRKMSMRLQSFPKPSGQLSISGSWRNISFLKFLGKSTERNEFKKGEGFQGQVEN